MTMNHPVTGIGKLNAQAKCLEDCHIDRVVSVSRVYRFAISSDDLECVPVHVKWVVRC